MLFSKENLSHKYADSRRGILDSTAWRIVRCTFPGGGRVDILHLLSLNRPVLLNRVGFMGVLRLKQVIKFHYLAS